MADIKLKDLEKLETWNTKELRKLRMTLNNRINELESASSPKKFSENHPLFEKDQDDCKVLLRKIMKQEKSNSRTD
jgi:hypothetical protein